MLHRVSNIRIFSQILYALLLGYGIPIGLQGFGASPGAAYAANEPENWQNLLAEMRNLQNTLVREVQAVQAREDTLSRLEKRLETLAADEQGLLDKLEADRRATARLLGALQRLSLHPKESYMVPQRRPLDQLHSAALLRHAVPALEARAADLRRQLETLASLREEIARERTAIAAAAADLLQYEKRVEGLVKKRTALADLSRQQSQAYARRAQALAEKAGDLRELLEGLTELEPLAADFNLPDAPLRPAGPIRSRQPTAGAAAIAALPRAPEAAERDRRGDQASLASAGLAANAGPVENAPQLAALPSPEAASPEPIPVVRPFPRKTGGLILPARGVEIRGFGHKIEYDDSRSRGIVIATRQGAQVVAPFDGQVKFRGPFRGYGEILIIEHGQEYHTLLAGLGRIDVETGSWLVAGEPIGAMGTPEKEKPELYIEIRHKGDPIDPSPLLAKMDVSQ